MFTINVPTDEINWKEYKVGQARLTERGNLRILLDNEKGEEIGFVQINNLAELVNFNLKG